MTLQRTDPVITQILARLRPQLVKVAADVENRARQATDVTLPRPATVEAFTAADGIAIVTVDGDTGPAEAQVVTAYPLLAGDRVFVLFAPPHGLLVIGHVHGFPVIAGEDDTGFSNALAVSPSWTTLKTLTIGDQPLGRAYRLVAKTDFGIYSFAAGNLSVDVSLGVSVDGGASYVNNLRTTSAPGSLLYGGGSVSKSAAGSSNEFRPRIRVRARLLNAAGGAYDIRDLFTTWTITPQEA